jgi:NAD(P)H-dependent flavin oxidoreductase YrpB (nitropropane dioxygenase family)
MFDTAMTDLVGCSVPIQQAPMGSVASPGLVRAVADAGGLGTLSAMGRSVDELVEALDGVRTTTTGAISANFLTDNMDRECIQAAASRVRVSSGAIPTRPWSNWDTLAAPWPAGRSGRFARHGPRPTRDVT